MQLKKPTLRTAPNSAQLYVSEFNPRPAQTLVLSAQAAEQNVAQARANGAAPQDLLQREQGIKGQLEHNFQFSDSLNERFAIARHQFDVRSAELKQDLDRLFKTQDEYTSMLAQAQDAGREYLAKSAAQGIDNTQVSIDQDSARLNQLENNFRRDAEGFGESRNLVEFANALLDETLQSIQEVLARDRS
jgi:hypothetical protein